MQRAAAILLVLGLVWLGLREGPRASAQGAGSYTYFPSPSNVDGRMLALAGTPFATLAGTRLEFRLAVPAGSTSFEIGVFDGDTGKDPSGAQVDPGGSWDFPDISLPNRGELIYELYPDPLSDGAPTTRVGQWFGNRTNPTRDNQAGWQASAATMPDNGWWDLTVDTSSAAKSPAGHFFYRFTVTLQEQNSFAFSAFKLRALGQVSLNPSTFGFAPTFNQYSDGYAIYPTWAGDYPPADPFFFLNAPTNYDGTWSFHMDVPVSQDSVTIWDGDMDKGNAPGLTSPSLLALLADADTKDPDTPPGLPPFASGVNDLPDAARPLGNPEDDSFIDALRRSPQLRIEVTDRNGRVVVNENPSGDREWEQFRITVDPLATRTSADYAPNVAADGTNFVRDARLQPGTWQITVLGQDLGNLAFLNVDHHLLGVDQNGNPLTPLRPFLVGDLVWRDTNLNGVKDGSESGIAGVLVHLLDSAGEVVASTSTDAGGAYQFNVPAGSYSVQVGYSNFGPGRALQGLNSTTGGNRQSGVVSTANVLTLDFGYHVGGSNTGTVPIGGTVWHDQNGNAVQESGEPGFAGVTVTLQGDTNADGIIDVVRTTVTDQFGAYEFAGLSPGTYTVIVNPATLAAGLTQTYDVDGLLTLHQATITLAANQSRSGISFGYRNEGPLSGPYTTQTQGGWGQKPSGNNAGAKLAANFQTVYPTGSVVIGGVKTLTFTSASAIEKFLPQGGAPQVLTTSYTNTTRKLGVLSGQVLALRLNVDFSAAGIHRAGLGALTVASGKMQGSTVTQVLSIGNLVLGGTTAALPPGVSISDLNSVITSINENFVDGTTNKGFLL